MNFGDKIYDINLFTVNLSKVGLNKMLTEEIKQDGFCIRIADEDMA